MQSSALPRDAASRRAAGARSARDRAHQAVSRPAASSEGRRRQRARQALSAAPSRGAEGRLLGYAVRPSSTRSAASSIGMRRRGAPLRGHGGQVRVWGGGLSRGAYTGPTGVRLDGVVGCLPQFIVRGSCASPHGLMCMLCCEYILAHMIVSTVLCCIVCAQTVGSVSLRRTPGQSHARRIYQYRTNTITDSKRDRATPSLNLVTVEPESLHQLHTNIWQYLCQVQSSAPAPKVRPICLN